MPCPHKWGLFSTRFYFSLNKHIENNWRMGKAGAVVEPAIAGHGMDWIKGYRMLLMLKVQHLSDRGPVRVCSKQ